MIMYMDRTAFQIQWERWSQLNFSYADGFLCRFPFNGNSGKGTVSSLWLLFLEMRSGDSAQRLNSELCTCKSWPCCSGRSTKPGLQEQWGKQDSCAQWGNLSPRGDILLRHHKSEGVTHHPWDNGIKALKGQAAVTSRSQASGAVIRDFIPSALHSLLSTLLILVAVMFILESLGLMQWKV